jgi:hypothetical protein
VGLGLSTFVMIERLLEKLWDPMANTKALQAKGVAAVTQRIQRDPHERARGVHRSPAADSSFHTSIASPSVQTICLSRIASDWAFAGCLPNIRSPLPVRLHEHSTRCKLLGCRLKPYRLFRNVRETHAEVAMRNLADVHLREALSRVVACRVWVCGRPF